MLKKATSGNQLVAVNNNHRSQDYRQVGITIGLEKYEVIMYYDINRIVNEEIEGIKKLLNALKGSTDDEPKGNLLARISNNGMIYHVRERIAKGKRKSRRLGDEFDSEVIKYKQRDFNRKLRKTLEHDLALLEMIKDKYLSYDPDSIDEALGPIMADRTGMVNKNPGMMSDEEWKRVPYKSNSFGFNGNFSTAYDGQPVRSKSEVILYNISAFLGLTFHYEEDIELYNEAGERVYKNVDFKYLDKHQKAVLLEHMGKLSDEQYFENAMHRIRLLLRNGYKLNDTLLITADDMEGKIDTLSIVRMLKARFEIT